MYSIENHGLIYELVSCFETYVWPVSYTHLDVYKRQAYYMAKNPDVEDDQSDFREDPEDEEKIEDFTTTQDSPTSRTPDQKRVR